MAIARYLHALTDAERDAIQEIADKMEGEFWAVSAAEDSAKAQILVDNGMTISAADDSLSAKLAEAGNAMWQEFFAKVPEAQSVVEAYAAKLGK